MAVRNMRDTVLKIQDGTPVTPLSITVPCMDGTLEFDEDTPASVIMHRGKIHSRREGDEVPCKVKFEIKFEQWQASAGVSGTSVRDALKKEGGASAWVSTDACGPFAVTLILDITNPCTPAEKETLTFNDFHCEKIKFKEGSDFHTISVEGTCLAVKPVRTYA
ncbi:MAG: hypothetical protein H0X04_00155 [Chthoniobacterales bacterium]|nr:hypothetical protein [Chthoniobacterales bacterium]